MASHKRFGIWCRRQDDSWSDFQLIMESPDGSRKMYTYSIAGPAKIFFLHEESVEPGEELAAEKIGETVKQDVDVIGAICNDFELAIDAASPAHWLQNIIDELCTRSSLAQTQGVC